MTSNSPLSTLHFPLPELIAGAAKIEITPSESVWMDGMIREHKSEGVHDPLHARAVYLSSDHDPANGAVIASVDVCAIRAEDALAVRREIEARTGVPSGQIIIAATHTHSGPATIGFFNAAEEGYLAELRAKLAGVIGKAVRTARPAVAGCASGLEGTISHYRRLLADDGHVVMNWEPWPEDRIVRVLGEPDPEVGVMVVAGRDDPARAIAVVFNHAGHPNVMSGGLPRIRLREDRRGARRDRDVCERRARLGRYRRSQGPRLGGRRARRRSVGGRGDRDSGTGRPV